MADITISENEYKRLCRDSAILSALEAGGVDNWEWYSESLAGLLDDDDDEEEDD